MSHPLLPKNSNKDNALFRQGKPDFLKLAIDPFPIPTDPKDIGAILEVTDTGDRFRWTGSAWIQNTLEGFDLVHTDADVTTYGEQAIAEGTPIAQLNSSYGILNNILAVVDAAASGSNTIADNMYTCKTGTTLGGLASILSQRQMKVRAGQSGKATFDAKFSVGVAGSQQVAGLITAENIFGFGKSGTTFGIFHAFNGIAENEELTLTAAASGAEASTVTIDGTAYPVALTAGTVQDNAFEIAEALNGVVPNYTITSNDDQVVAQALISGIQSTFAFSSPGTAAGTWAQITIGAEPTVLFTPQVSWNVNTRIAGDVKTALVPTNGNFYQIRLGMGFCGVNFYLHDSATGRLVRVHRLEYSNQNTVPITSNHTYRVGWLARSISSTTDIIVQGDSASMSVEGRIERSVFPLSAFNNQLAVGSTPTNIITFRVRSSFRDKVNRIEVLPDLIAVSTESNKVSIFQLVANPVYSGNLDWSYLDKDSSVTEIATDAVTLISGTPIGTVVVAPGTSFPIKFNVSKEQITALPPNFSLGIVGNVTSGSAGDMQGSSIFTEDH